MADMDNILDLFGGVDEEDTNDNNIKNENYYINLNLILYYYNILIHIPIKHLSHNYTRHYRY